MTQPPPGIPELDVAETSTRLGSGSEPRPVLVDVREPDELQAVRVAGAVHVPMSSFAERYGELPRDRPLLVMCASGARSAAATGFLLRNGWTDVHNVAGGIKAWQLAGLPVKRGALEPGEGEL